MVERNRSYPGLTGVPQAHPDWNSFELNAEESTALRNILRELVRDRRHPHVSDLEGYIAALANTVQLYRCWRRIAEESQLKSRKANLRLAIRSWKSRRRMTLSQINAIEFSDHLLARGNPVEALTECLEVLNNRGAGSGKRPEDEADLACDAIRQCFEEFTGKRVTMSRHGSYHLTCEAVIGLARREPPRSLLTRIEQLLSRGTLIAASSETGVDGRTVNTPRYFRLPRLNK